MKSDFNLSLEDIKPKNENALELFYSGIKSAQTRRSMEGNLKTFLVNACAEIFSGDYKQRVQEFVDLSKEDQDRATSIVIAYVRKLRERASLDKNDPNYLNPSSIPNKIKPIRKLLEMNGLGLGWKRIYSLYPEKDNTNKGRAYTRAELQKMLEYSDSIEGDFIILAASSGGFRVGAWNDQTWGNIFPVYEINGEYKITLEKDDKNFKVVCAAMMVYKNSPEEYVTLISIEAWNKLLEYKKVWTSRMKREPVDSDPLLLERRLEKNIITLTDTAVSRRILKLLIQSGMRAPLTEGKRRHEVPMIHGFRRYWDKVMMETTKKRGTLSALVIDFAMGYLVRSNSSWVQRTDVGVGGQYSGNHTITNDSGLTTYHYAYNLNQATSSNTMYLVQTIEQKGILNAAVIYGNSYTVRVSATASDGSAFVTSRQISAG